VGQETLGGSCKHVEEMKGGVWFIVQFAWEMGWKLGMWWYMINQIGDEKDEVQWDMMN
jgi:hypothetical protein